MRELRSALPSLPRIAQITHSVQAVALLIHTGYLWAWLMITEHSVCSASEHGAVTPVTLPSTQPWLVAALAIGCFGLVGVLSYRLGLSATRKPR